MFVLVWFQQPLCPSVRILTLFKKILVNFCIHVFIITLGYISVSVCEHQPLPLPFIISPLAQQFLYLVFFSSLTTAPSRSHTQAYKMFLTIYAALRFSFNIDLFVFLPTLFSYLCVLHLFLSVVIVIRYCSPSLPLIQPTHSLSLNLPFPLSCFI